MCAYETMSLLTNWIATLVLETTVPCVVGFAPLPQCMRYKEGHFLATTGNELFILLYMLNIFLFYLLTCYTFFMQAHNVVTIKLVAINEKRASRDCVMSPPETRALSPDPITSFP